MARLAATYRYDKLVFLAPPWPEIYVNDAERQHDLQEAMTEYDALCQSYPAKGYELVVLPKTSIAARADWLLDKVLPDRRKS